MSYAQKNFWTRVCSVTYKKPAPSPAIMFDTKCWWWWILMRDPAIARWACQCDASTTKKKCPPKAQADHMQSLTIKSGSILKRNRIKKGQSPEMLWTLAGQSMVTIWTHRISLASCKIVKWQRPDPSNCSKQQFRRRRKIQSHTNTNQPG